MNPIIKANKSLGQHFIYNTHITDKIVSFCQELHGTTFEIGPGPGTLTSSLIKKVSRLIVIERDAQFIPHLKKLSSEHPFQIIHANALTQELHQLTPIKPIRIVSNLPYNISTELLYIWLESGKPFDEMILMFQKEVGERIIASANNKQYGKLTIMVQNLYHASPLMVLSPNAFSPPPKVQSMLIRLHPRNDFLIGFSIHHNLKNLLNIAFSKKRKMLKHALRPILQLNPHILKNANINPTLRPENLSLEDWRTLAQLIA